MQVDNNKKKKEKKALNYMNLFRLFYEIEQWNE